MCIPFVYTTSVIIMAKRNKPLSAKCDSTRKNFRRIRNSFNFLIHITHIYQQSLNTLARTHTTFQRACERTKTHFEFVFCHWTIPKCYWNAPLAPLSTSSSYRDSFTLNWIKQNTLTRTQFRYRTHAISVKICVFARKWFQVNVYYGILEHLRQVECFSNKSAVF